MFADLSVKIAKCLPVTPKFLSPYSKKKRRHNSVLYFPLQFRHLILPIR